MLQPLFNRFGVQSDVVVPGFAAVREPHCSLPGSLKDVQFLHRPPRRSISALHPQFPPSSSSSSSSFPASASLPLQVDGGWKPRRHETCMRSAAVRLLSTSLRAGDHILK
ncbi:hypothetical protein Q8A73_015518 [Channa argus]|nr:hypothetical protein Q8A73_015518 [Channa argus]